MASDITPGNIDGTYPIAGIDNDSQGFRTNFTNTSTNLAFAKAELEDLQSKSILKAPLDGEGSTDNDMLGEILQSATLLDTRETIYSHGTTSGAVVLDHLNGQYQTVTANGSMVLSFTNFPGTAGTPVLGRVRVEITIADVADTVTIPASVTIGVDSIRGLSGLVITFDAAGTYVLDFTNYDNTGDYTIIDQTRGSATPLPMLINAQVAAAYETVLSDAGVMVTLSDAGANTITIPANSAVAYPIGTQLNFQQAGAGTTTIAITTDTLNSAGSLFDLNGQYAVATALKMTATTWTLFGNLA